MFCRGRNQSGSVLVAVLWTLAMLAVFLVALKNQVNAELVFGKWMMGRVVTRHLAASGIERAVLVLRKDRFKTFDALNKDWAVNEEAFREISLGKGTFSVVCDGAQGYGETESGFRRGMCDEAARLNLNFISETAMKRLIQSFFPDLKKEDLETAAQSVIDWRDGDDEPMSSGAEASYYQSRKTPYLPRNGEFKSVEELQLVRGITPEIYQAVSPYLTAYTDGKVNINTVPQKVLYALGMNEDLAGRVISFRMGADNKQGTKDDEVFQYPDAITSVISTAVPLSPEDLAEVSNAASEGVFSTRSDVFRIYSIGRLIRGVQTMESRITAVVRRSDESFLYWREY